MDMPRGIVLIYFPIYQPGPLCAVNKNWMSLTPHQRHYREREWVRERKTLLFNAGEEFPVTLAGKPVFHLRFKTLPANSIYSVPAFHGFWIESSTILSVLFSSFFLLCFTLKLPQKEKSTLLAKWDLGFGLLFSIYLLWPFLILVYFFWGGSL